MLAEFSVYPTSGAHMGKAIAKVVETLEGLGLEYRLGPMSTTIEGDLEQVLTAIRRCHEAVVAGQQRVITSIMLDDCPDHRLTLADAVARVEQHVGHAVKH